MSVVKRSRPLSPGFVTVSNTIAQSHSDFPWLSFGARGLLLYLLSKPPDWKCQIEDIEREGRLGRVARKTLFEELERAGYLTFQQFRDEAGQFHSEWTVYDAPLEPELRTARYSTPPANRVVQALPERNPGQPGVGFLPADDRPADDRAADDPPPDNLSIYKERSTNKREREKPLPLVSEQDDLKPQLSPIREALRQALSWPEVLSPKQWSQLFQTEQSLARYNGQARPEVLRQAGEFYKAQKRISWSPLFLESDFPRLLDWYNSTFGSSASSLSPAARRLGSDPLAACPECGGRGVVRGGSVPGQPPVFEYCSCPVGDARRSEREKVSV